MGMGGSQPGEGGLGHPQATYMSSKVFLLLACLKCTMENSWEHFPQANMKHRKNIEQLYLNVILTFILFLLF
jgi:hypothetical protein